MSCMLAFNCYGCIAYIHFGEASDVYSVWLDLFLSVHAKSQVHLKQAAVRLQACHSTQETSTLWL